MSRFQIFIDSTGDLNKEQRDRYGLDYCPMSVSWGGKDYPASLDWDQGFTAHEYYDIMRGGTRIFTSQVTAPTFLEKFEPIFQKGEDILYIACSSGLSASINSARTVVAQLEKKYPGRKAVCFDSLISSFGQDHMAIVASEMQKDGKSLDEVVAWLEKNKLRFNQFAAIDDLSYLRRAGRVSASSAFFGNLFGVKPILISDAKGHNLATKKVKGRKASLLEIVKEAVEACDDPKNALVFVGHIDDQEGADFVVDELKKAAPIKEIRVGMIGPIVGASTGPGTVAIYCFGKEVTVVGE